MRYSSRVCPFLAGRHTCICHRWVGHCSARSPCAGSGSGPGGAGSALQDGLRLACWPAGLRLPAPATTPLPRMQAALPPLLGPMPAKPPFPPRFPCALPALCCAVPCCAVLCCAHCAHLEHLARPLEADQRLGNAGRLERHGDGAAAKGVQPREEGSLERPAMDETAPAPTPTHPPTHTHPPALPPSTRGAGPLLLAHALRAALRANHASASESRTHYGSQ